MTLVILTHNRADELARTLERALALPERPPIIVVDNASTDGTAQLVARRFPAVRLIHMTENLGAAGRNAGADAAITPYVAFGDDDSVWAPGSLRGAVALLDAHPKVAAIGARVLVGEEAVEDPLCAELAASPLPSDGLPGPSVLGFLACAVVFRRDAFLAAGGYERRFMVGGEESLLAYDLVTAGWSIVYAGHLTVHHYPSPTRNPARRRRVQSRNALWVAWLRRPWPAALRLTLRREALPGLLAALRGLPWALRHRRVVPPHVEALRRRLELASGVVSGVSR